VTLYEAHDSDFALHNQVNSRKEVREVFALVPGRRATSWCIQQSGGVWFASECLVFLVWGLPRDWCGVCHVIKLWIKTNEQSYVDLQFPK